MIRVKWLAIQIVATLQVICFVESFPYENDFKIETACTGRCSYEYSLQCPSSQKIALHSLEYGAKDVSQICPNVKESCQKKDECCSYDSRDCRIQFLYSVAYSVYAKCSGKQECHELRAGQISSESYCSYRNYTNYVAAKYSCVDDNTFVDICSNGTVYGKAVNLILNGSQPQHSGFENSNLCACVISTSDCESRARLRFQAVDVRLHQNQDITRCHPHSLFDIIDGEYGSYPRSYKCTPNYFQREYNDLYFSKKPYARISLYNKPELNISQLWLHIIATLPDVEVMVTCGSAAVHHASSNICVPPEFYPTTTVVHSPPTTYNIIPEENKDPNPGNIGQETDWVPIIAGAIAAIIIVAIIIILVIYCRRKTRMKKEAEDRFSHSLTVTSQPLPSPVENDYENEYDGCSSHYYDSVGNGRTFTPSPFVQLATPGKNMGSFFPTEPKKVSPPIVPVVPPTVPSNPPPEQPSAVTYNCDANPYQQPWDGKPLPTPNRLKKGDLAYATSDEIQVLIQRMDNERKQLNEGETCTSPTGFIHIDDYKLANSAKEKEECVNEEEEEVDNDNQKLLEHRNSSHLLEDRHSRLLEDRHLLEHVHIDPNDVMCSSEDTGYRSVGSQEQILVSEDDYLVPKTRKEDTSLPQRPSSQSEVKGDKSSNRLSASEEKGSINGDVAKDQYADVYDALEEGKTMDIKTKF